MRGGARNPGDAGGRGARPRVIHVAIALCLMAPGITPSSAAANANRCGTSVPNEPPTAVNGFGSQWFNEHGVAAQAPPSDTFGYAGIAFNHQSAQVNALNNNSIQNVTTAYSLTGNRWQRPTTFLDPRLARVTASIQF